MFKNYLKTAWRNLYRNKFYSTINIAGLATGLAVGIMILLWVEDEFSYDRFHANYHDIYRVTSNVKSSDGFSYWADAPAPLTIFSRQNPDVVATTRISEGNYNFSFFRYNDKVFTEDKQAYVDSNFFSFFSFPLLKGNRQHPFPDNNSVIITASLARKYFGDAEPVGKIITTNTGEPLIVTGVAANFPHNSTIQLNMFFPMTLYGAKFTAGGGNGNWKTIDEDLGDYMHQVFFRLGTGASATISAKRITEAYFSHRRPEDNTGSYFSLQPLSHMHLYGTDGNNSGMQMVRIFMIVAILILLIACINYVNLSTARSMIRAKEVSMRKIIGAGRWQLFRQFLLETALLYLFAASLACFLVMMLMPLYNDISGKSLEFNLADVKIWKIILISITGTLVASSIYPALLLSGFKPLEALKGKVSARVGAGTFRKVLVVIQFSFSVLLIICTLIIRKQMQYVREKNLGYDKLYVMGAAMPAGMQDHFDAVKTTLLKQPGIKAVSAGNQDIIHIQGTTSDTDWKGKPKNSSFLIHPMRIDEDFIPLMKLQLKEGSNFTGSVADSGYYILNETSVNQMGIRDPVGKTFSLWGKQGTIIGVVKDFHYASLKQKIEPQIFYYWPAASNWMLYVKTSGKEASKAIAALEKVWKQYSPDAPFAYWFLDSTFDTLYRSDQQAGTLFNAFAIIAIFISCLGLLGLATYTMQVRKKEIGIRKVLGADALNITRLLNRDFIRLVLISILIASPVGWWASNHWLQDFAYRVPLSGWIFLIAGLLSIFIALATISIQAVRAALANPVNSLRSE